MALNLQDWVDQRIYATGLYEADVIRVVRALLKKGGTAIDVGANIGFFSLLFAFLVGASGTVVSFEPGKSIRHRLLRNLGLNPGLRVDVRPIALSDKAEKCAFYYGPLDHSGISSLRALADASGIDIVQTLPLDCIVPPEVPVHLIKIDVEGAEQKVIDGMQRIIDHWHPDLIIEISPLFLAEMGSSVECLCDRLWRQGYSMFRIHWDGLERIAKWRNMGSQEQFNALFTVRQSLPIQLSVRNGRAQVPST